MGVIYTAGKTAVDCRLDSEAVHTQKPTRTIQVYSLPQACPWDKHDMTVSPMSAERDVEPRDLAVIGGDAR